MLTRNSDDDPANPDFVLTIDGVREESNWRPPRKCWPRRTVSGESGGLFTLVTIQPVIIGQQYGLGARDFDQLLLQNRFRPDETLVVEVGEPPLAVSVFLPFRPPLTDPLPDSYFGRAMRMPSPVVGLDLVVPHDEQAGAFLVQVGFLWPDLASIEVG